MTTPLTAADALRQLLPFFDRDQVRQDQSVAEDRHRHEGYNAACENHAAHVRGILDRLAALPATEPAAPGTDALREAVKDFLAVFDEDDTALHARASWVSRYHGKIAALRAAIAGTAQPATPEPAEKCGAWGVCAQPIGHNMGNPDLPEYHRPLAKTPEPAPQQPVAGRPAARHLTPDEYDVIAAVQEFLDGMMLNADDSRIREDLRSAFPRGDD